MRFRGTVRINSPIDRVWDFLTDPEAVGGCVPDLQSLERVDSSRFRAVVRAGVGPVRGNFTFDVVWQELLRPNRARLVAQGKAPGSAVTVDSTMDLSPAKGEATSMDWSADVAVHGMLASVGARLLTGVVEKKTEEFFDRVRAALELPG